MDRRELLKKLLLSLPALSLGTSFFTSCKKEELFADLNYDGKVIIIGAGAAGMYAAYLLHKQNVEVTLLEASSLYGGRVRALAGFSDFPIELGAEEVHGQKSVWYDLIKSTNAGFAEGETRDFYLLDNLLKEEASVSGDAEFITLQELLETLENSEDSSVPDITAEAYGQQKGISSRVAHIYNALVGNEHGTSNTRISAFGVAEENKLWTAGNDNFLLNGRSHISIFEERFAEILPKIQLNTQIKTIDYSGTAVMLTDQNGATYSADKVIITVPLTILRDGDISFIPSLPSSKTEAFGKIGMGAGMKIILKFNTRFWPEDTGSIYGVGLVPEFWSTGTGRSLANNVLTAFVHGENAEVLSAQGAVAVATALQELDAMYGAGVASGALVDSFIMNWTNEPFVKGTYSYPVAGGAGARENLATPVQDKLFFAGEATNYNGHFGSVHGAMETGFRAVNELLKTVQQ